MFFIMLDELNYLPIYLCRWMKLICEPYRISEIPMTPVFSTTNTPALLDALPAMMNNNL